MKSVHTQQVNKQDTTNSSILERPNDPTLYRVWVGFSTSHKLWADMTTHERLMQIESERRAEHVVLNSIYS